VVLAGARDRAAIATGGPGQTPSRSGEDDMGGTGGPGQSPSRSRENDMGKESIRELERYMVDTKALLTCPHCGESYQLEMPTNQCQVALDCPECGERITPKPGDWCIFCSYADKPCPPLQ